MAPPERYMQTDLIDREGLEKRMLGEDEVAALARLQAEGCHCLVMSWGTRAPRFCGRLEGHEGTHLFFSPLENGME